MTAIAVYVMTERVSVLSVLLVAIVAGTLLAKLKAFFYANPNMWVDGRRLANIAGAYAWRSRVSDLRLGGMRITNRQRKVRGRDGAVFVISEYRFEASLLDLAGDPLAQTDTSVESSDILPEILAEVHADSATPSASPEGS